MRILINDVCDDKLRPKLIMSNNKLIEMKKDDSFLNGNSQIMELSEVSLFEDDPYSDQIDVLRSSSEILTDKVHLFAGQNLYHENTFRVGLESDSKHLNGRYEILVSNYRAIFFNFGQQVLPYEQQNVAMETPISIPFSIISLIEPIKSQIMLKLKTTISICLKSSVSDTKEIYKYFMKGNIEIPFFPRYIFPKEESISYDCLVEMQRMRMNWEYLIIVKNANGELCPSYPKYFIVPKKIEQNLLEECLKIRNGARIPVATYYWTDCRSALWRTARLKPHQEGNKFNHAYLRQINREPFFIDLRDEDSPSTVSLLSRNTHINMTFLPLNQLNILFKKFCLAYAKDEKIFLLLEKWYEDIHSLIQTAYMVVDQMRVGRQLILIENFGADRACQVSALAQIIIDPYYRTIAGFSILVEKEFINFGHPFNYRLAFEPEKLTEESPVFIQFLQCVHHIVTAHPRCFEFSSCYLARVAYEAITGKYHNFFFNDEDMKKKYNLMLRTQSIWKHMPMRKQYYNYQWNERYAVKPLIAVRSMPSLKEFMVWHEFYDMVNKMRAEHSPEGNVRGRKSSLYKLLNHKE